MKKKKLEDMTEEEAFYALSSAAGMVPPTDDETLEEYCHRKYEELQQDPEHQKFVPVVEYCTRPDGTVDMKKLKR